MNGYVPAVPELREAALRARRIGLGIMGLGDMFYQLGIRYGSPESLVLAGEIAEFLRYHAMIMSVDLAVERGPFPAIDGSIYDAKNTKSPDSYGSEFEFRRLAMLLQKDGALGGVSATNLSLKDFSHLHFPSGSVDWRELGNQIFQHGIRNACQTTCAPTGTISTVAGVEGYGCEPVFALAYTRWVVDGDNRLPLTYVSPLFEQALADAGLSQEERQRVIEQVAITGSCQNVDDVPEEVKRVFVVSSDITPEEHVKMQAALQAFTSNAISKTINFPPTATVEDVANSYMLAWELGCKGLTVYVTGSRETVVLETKETQAKKAPLVLSIQPEVEPMKPRPDCLSGQTHKVATPVGQAYVTVNRNGHNEPFEVFLNVGKAGTDIFSISEALGRLVSLILRIPSSLSPTERLRQVAEQLSGIGGGRSIGFGANRVLSLPDAIARMFGKELGITTIEIAPQLESQSTWPTIQRTADLCPSCGHVSLVNEEGCRKCYSCAYSEC